MIGKTEKQLDFTKYRNQQLVSSVVELIDVKTIYVRALKVMLLLGLAVGGIAAAYYWARFDGWIWGVLVGVATLAGIWLGGLVAFFLFLNRSIHNMSNIVSELLELTKIVSIDVRSVNSGAVEMPSTQDLVKGLYGQVVLPIVEESVADQLGFLGGPVLFAYRITLGKLVRWTIRLLPADTLTRFTGDKSAQELVDETMAKAQTVADNEDRIVKSLTFVQSKLTVAGLGLRILVLGPWMIIVFVALLSIAALLVLIGTLA